MFIVSQPISYIFNVIFIRRYIFYTVFSMYGDLFEGARCDIDICNWCKLGSMYLQSIHFG